MKKEGDLIGVEALGSFSEYHCPQMGMTVEGLGGKSWGPVGSSFKEILIDFKKEVFENIYHI